MYADLAISVVLAALFGFLALGAEQWNYRSALFPQVIGVAGLVAVAVLVFVRVVLKKIPGASPVNASTDGAEEPPVADRVSGDDRVRALRLLAWMVGVVAMSWLLGQMVAMSLFMLAFLRYESEASWPAAALGAAITGGFLYVIFDRILVVTWLDGAVYRWLGAALG